MIFRQGTMRFQNAELPGKTGMMNGAVRGSPGAAVITRNQNHLGAGFGNPAGNCSDALLADKLYRDPCVTVCVFQIIDQLRKIFDRIYVMMRRRRDQGDARC